MGSFSQRHAQAEPLFKNKIRKSTKFEQNTKKNGGKDRDSNPGKTCAFTRSLGANRPVLADEINGLLEFFAGRKIRKKPQNRPSRKTFFFRVLAPDAYAIMLMQ